VHDTEAIKTYRYLRIGIVGVVLLLGVSVAYEHVKASCWQTSISAYYYTPVRVIFAGGLLAIGLCLIVIKGSTAWEDALLNVAGMLAPIVALVPTADSGTCWSIKPIPLPTSNGVMAPWVLANIHNNVASLLVAGFAGLVVAAVIAMVATKSWFAIAEVGEKGTRLGLLGALGLLTAGALLFHYWDNFATRAHGFAAVAMFAALAAAVGCDAWSLHTDATKQWYFRLYAAISVTMVVFGALMLTVGRHGTHSVLVLEVVEIALFASSWLVQTREHWNETSGMSG
jgi:hypothetical protein